VEKLKRDTKDHPSDVQAWILLGGVYDKIRHYAEAADAYRHALALDPGNTELKAALGVALVAQDGGAVEGQALELFKESPREPSSRYHLALAQSQAGDWQDALTAWQALAADGPANAPWLPATQTRIADARRALGLDTH
jgi:cytochrome c-type biogenesis protein CcmH